VAEPCFDEGQIKPSFAEVDMDEKLEVIVIAVSDVDRAKAFYARLGWRLDADLARGSDYRVVQFTPPGSACSVQFGIGLTAAAPGSAQRTYLVVSDIVEKCAELAARGVVSEIMHRDGPGPATLSGPHPKRQSYASFASFADPDGNSWLLQEVTARLPGRLEAGNATFSSSSELAAALKRAAAAHGQHEKRIGKQDPDWPAWYAEFLVAEQSGKPLPT
jgi:catechol 2,3-dioxygenase-like lactoylglutathione lyase family enzyme